MPLAIARHFAIAPIACWLHGLGYAARIAILAAVAVGSHTAQAAVNYFILDITGTISTISDQVAGPTVSLSVAASIQASCSTVGQNAAVVAYYGTSNGLYSIAYAAGTPFNARLCVPGVPSTVTLTPIPWAGNGASTKSVSLGGASVSLPTYAWNDGWNRVATGIILPDNKVIGAKIGWSSNGGACFPAQYCWVPFAQFGAPTLNTSDTYSLLGVPGLVSGLVPHYVLGF